MFIGDSQTMTAESAVLGTPALRFNDLVGELSYLEDLEHNYGLTYGIKTADVNKLYEKLNELLLIPNLKTEWHTKREFMLTKKVDFAKWMLTFFNEYPNSVKASKS
jgi:predicted glycosyltransferase